MSWTIQPYQDQGDLVVHDCVWTVLTNDDNTEAVFALRVGDHGVDVLAEDDEWVKLIFSPEMAQAMVEQFIHEAVPYMDSLIEGSGA